MAIDNRPSNRIIKVKNGGDIHPPQGELSKNAMRGAKGQDLDFHGAEYDYRGEPVEVSEFENHLRGLSVDALRSTAEQFGIEDAHTKNREELVATLCAIRHQDLSAS